MQRIGRKLYIDWGSESDPYVIAIEKLPGCSALAPGLTREGDADRRARVVDIFDFDGERLEIPVSGTRNQISEGLDFNQILTDTSCWMTREEAGNCVPEPKVDDRNIKLVAEPGTIGYVSGWVFFILSAWRLIEIEEWVRDHPGTKMWGGVVLIDNSDLAAEFQIRFG